MKGKISIAFFIVSMHCASSGACCAYWHRIYESLCALCNQAPQTLKEGGVIDGNMLPAKYFWYRLSAGNGRGSVKIGCVPVDYLGWGPYKRLLDDHIDRVERHKLRDGVLNGESGRSYTLCWTDDSEIFTIIENDCGKRRIRTFRFDELIALENMMKKKLAASSFNNAIIFQASVIALCLQSRDGGLFCEVFRCLESIMDE